MVTRVILFECIKRPFSQLCPVGWGYGIHRLLLCRRVRPLPNECPRYDTKQSYGEAPVMLELWGMRCTTSLPSPPSLLWSELIARDRVLSMGQIELKGVLMLYWIAWNGTVLTFKLRTYAKLNCLKKNSFDIWLFVNKNYSYTKQNCLKFNSALNDPKRVDTS